MLDLLGRRQKDLLRLLLRNKNGLTIDELRVQLGVTRNAIRQHLAALMAAGLVARGQSQATRGRPTQLYVLTQKSKELFPRQYSWLSQLMLESIRDEPGGDGLRVRLRNMGAKVAAQLREQHPGLKTRRDRVLKLAELMEQLGYDTAATSVLDPTTISADNCVFHDLAQKDPAICEFDVALAAGFTDSQVDQTECMAKGGQLCRFKFRPKP